LVETCSADYSATLRSTRGLYGGPSQNVEKSWRTSTYMHLKTTNLCHVADRQHNNSLKLHYTPSQSVFEPTATTIPAYQLVRRSSRKPRSHTCSLTDRLASTATTIHFTPDGTLYVLEASLSHLRTSLLARIVFLVFLCRRPGFTQVTGTRAPLNAECNDTKRDRDGNLQKWIGDRVKLHIGAGEH